MLTYWLLFAGFVFVALSPLGDHERLAQHARSRGVWMIVFLILITMIGLRYEVGGDWGNYLRQLEMTPDALKDAVAGGDPAYGFLNWAAAESNLGIILVNSVAAILFTSGLIAFCRAQPDPWLALVVAIPYLIIVVAMGYTRQAVAIGFAMLGLACLDKGRVGYFVAYLAVAATFHKSAVILVPLAIVAGVRRRFYVLVLVATATFLLFTLLLQPSVEDLRENYLHAQYESSGAAVRIAMNAVPAFLFLVFRHRFNLPRGQRVFWSWIAVMALGFIPLLAMSPSSTAIDRLALYWIPLQLFVWSRLPGVLTRRYQWGKTPVYAVIAYSAVVMFVWFRFAENSLYWIPYRFYPLAN